MGPGTVENPQVVRYPEVVFQREQTGSLGFGGMEALGRSGLFGEARRFGTFSGNHSNRPWRNKVSLSSF
jgi:hypothetical protein